MKCSASPGLQGNFDPTLAAGLVARSTPKWWRCSSASLGQARRELFDEEESESHARPGLRSTRSASNACVVASPINSWRLFRRLRTSRRSRSTPSVHVDKHTDAVSLALLPGSASGSTQVDEAGVRPGRRGFAVAKFAVFDLAILLAYALWTGRARAHRLATS